MGICKSEVELDAAVSVIIPVYNAEKWLIRCLESVVNQSYPSLEIILVDDGSTDGSGAICQEYAHKDKRVSCIRQQNAGPGIARNAGIKAATSKFITFLDSDDWLELTYIEKIIRMMLETDSDIGQCDIRYVDYETSRAQIVKLRYNARVVSAKEDRRVVNKSRLFIWGKVFKTRLIRDCGFQFPALVFEDTLVPLLVIRANRICYVDQPLINHLSVRPQSLSNNREHHGDAVPSLQLLYDQLQEQGLYQAYALEYKKILLGQWRFCCRRWKDDGHAWVQMEEWGSSVFPSLKCLPEMTFYACGDDLLASALDKAIPYKRQIVNDAEKADVIVSYENSSAIPPHENKRALAVPGNIAPSKGPVVAVYDLAEWMMEAL